MTSITSSDAFIGLGDVLSPWTAVVVAAVTGYVALCRALRYTRRDTEHSQRPYRTREDFQKMTAEDAWEIIKYVQGCEFPWTTKKALSFALFRYVHDVCKHVSHLTPGQNLWNTNNLKTTV